MNTHTKKLTLSAMFLAIGIILPFFTGQVPQIGNMLLPMHFPVFLCGMICGAPYGLAIGFILPIFRSFLFGMPMMYPMMQKPSLLQSMKYSLNQLSMSSTIRTAQKTLYTVNQIIPIVNQLRPVVHNAKTAFRVVKAVKQFDFEDVSEEIDQNVNEDSPVFQNMFPKEKA